MSARDIAVVVPAYDSARFLPSALASVAAQTLAPAEVVVVDDGSSDDSAAVAERLGARCVRQENAGPAAARNRGVRESRAELIAFLDADDRFEPAKLARQLAAFDDPAVVACASDAWVERDGGTGAGRGRKNAGRSLPPRLALDGLLDDNPLVCSTVVVRRSAFEAAGGFDEDPVLIATEDYDLWLRLAELGAIAYLDEPLAVYRVHGASLSDDRRFAAGIDRIAAKVVARHPDLEDRLRRRRGRVRLDAAYHLARRGQGAAARGELRAARALGVAGWPAWKVWLRSWGGDGASGREHLEPHSRSS